MALSATANAELKVATVDVQKLFADYYKTHEAQAEVDKAAQTVQETTPARKPSKRWKRTSTTWSKGFRIPC